jgi:hypothetical protein
MYNISKRMIGDRLSWIISGDCVFAIALLAFQIIIFSIKSRDGSSMFAEKIYKRKIRLMFSIIVMVTFVVLSNMVTNKNSIIFTKFPMKEKCIENYSFGFIFFLNLVKIV